MNKIFNICRYFMRDYQFSNYKLTDNKRVIKISNHIDESKSKCSHTYRFSAVGKYNERQSNL